MDTLFPPWHDKPCTDVLAGMDYFEVPWTPRAKERPAFNSKTKRAYTPKPTRDAEAKILADFLDRYDSRRYNGPLIVDIEMWHDWFRIGVMSTDDYTERRLRGDVDNYGKTILDTFNEALWDDDAQIRDLRIRKA